MAEGKTVANSDSKEAARDVVSITERERLDKDTVVNQPSSRASVGVPADASTSNPRKRNQRRHPARRSNSQFKQDIVKGTIDNHYCTLLVDGKTGFPDCITATDLKQHFSKYERYISHTNVSKDRNGSLNGSITFTSYEVAESARQAFRETEIKGHLLYLSHSNVKQRTSLSNEKSHSKSTKSTASARRYPKTSSMCMPSSNSSASLINASTSEKDQKGAPLRHQAQCSPLPSISSAPLINITTRDTDRRSAPLRQQCKPLPSNSSEPLINAAGATSGNDQKNPLLQIQVAEGSGVNDSMSTPQPQCTLLVEGLHCKLPDDITDNDLKQHFLSFIHDIKSARMILDTHTQQKIGIVSFSTPQVASKAKKKYWATHLLKKYQLRVSHSDLKPQDTSTPIFTIPDTPSDIPTTTEGSDCTSPLGTTSLSIDDKVSASSETKSLCGTNDYPTLTSCDTHALTHDKSGSSATENVVETSTSSCSTIVVKNLSPRVSKEDLTAFIQCDAEIVSINIAPDHCSAGTCIGYISLANHSELPAMVNKLRNREFFQHKITVHVQESVEVKHKQASKQRKISPFLFDFVCDHNHDQIEQFKTCEGALEYHEDSVILSCPDESKITSILRDVFDNVVEKLEKFEASEWRKLTTSKSGHTTLLEKAKASFSSENKSNVYVVPQEFERALLYVGKSEEVTKAHSWLLSQLYRELNVERDKMEALSEIYPNLKSDLSKKYQVTIKQESLVMLIEGDGTAVQKAHQEIAFMISKYSTDEVQFEHARSLLESARKRLKVDHISVMIKEPVVAGKGDTSTPLILHSFCATDLKRASKILKGNPTYKSLKLQANDTIVTAQFKRVTSGITKELLVVIRRTYKCKNNILISGFVREDVVAAHTKLIENMPHFIATDVPQQSVISQPRKEKMQQLDQDMKKNSSSKLKPSTLPLSKYDCTSENVDIQTKDSMPTLSKRDSKTGLDVEAMRRVSSLHSELSSTENTQSITMLFESHYMPLLLSQEYADTISEIKEAHNVLVTPIHRRILNSVIKQAMFKRSSGELVVVQLCYCNLVYESTDAIVNISRKVPKEMQDVGGQSLQSELDKYIACHGLETSAAVLPSGRLPCKRIIHAFSSILKMGKECCFIHKVLQCAQEHNLKSISLPSTYENTLSPNELLNDVQTYFIKNPCSCVHMLRIVCTSSAHFNAFNGIEAFNNNEDVVNLSKVTPVINHPLSGSICHQWYWQADDDIFHPYSKPLNEALTLEYRNNPQGSYFFQVGLNHYSADFERMEQRNVDTHCVRRIKHEQISQFQDKGNSCENPGISVDVEWFHHSDGQESVPYSPAESKNLEMYFSSPTSATVTTVLGSKKFLVDFKTMKKHEYSTHSKAMHLERRVVVHQGSVSSEYAKWYYMDDKKTFAPYSKSDSVLIEQMYLHKEAGTLQIQSRLYTFDFNDMKQINKTTEFKRSIKREAQSTTAASSEPIPHHHRCKGIIVVLEGPSGKLKEAKTKLQTRLKSMMHTTELPLPTTISGLIDSQKKIICVAKKYNIACELSSAHDAESKVLKLSGDDKLIRKAVKAIMNEIASNKFAGASRVVSKIDVPSEWQPQVKNTELFELSKSSEEFIRIKSMFHLTMPTRGAAILSVKRIQNNWLWERYVMTRKRLFEKNNGRVNEKELFHGSRSSAAHVIYDSEEGFDMRYSSAGMWGQANYFAEKASYSNSYAYEFSDGTREMLLAKVLTGDSCKCVSDKTLRMPPVKENQTRFQQERYDTVQGETCGSTVYMTYSNDKAYPAYLIVYDPTLTTVYHYSGVSSSHHSASQTPTSASSWNYNLVTNPSSTHSSSSSGAGAANLRAASVQRPSSSSSANLRAASVQRPSSSSYGAGAANLRAASVQRPSSSSSGAGAANLRAASGQRPIIQSNQQRTHTQYNQANQNTTPSSNRNPSNQKASQCVLQ